VVGVSLNAALARYVVKRVLFMVPTLLGILLVTFALIQFVPGGPVEQMVQALEGQQAGHGGAGPSVPGMTAGADMGQTSGGVYRGRTGIDPKQLEEIKALYGFDKPVHERFFDMVVGFMQFDLGRSFFYNKTVWELIVEKLPVSISLGLWAFLITYAVSLPLGIAKAVRHGTPFDFYTSLVILVGYAIPGFVLGVIMLVFFGGGSFLQLFPLRGLTSDDFAELSLIGQVLDYLWHLVLPLTCLVLGSFAVVTMLTKNTMLEEIRRQYVLTARAKGLSEDVVLWRHVLRNALIPIVTGFPAAFVGAFFTGSLLIETLFSLDGLGLLSYEAVMKRDYPVVMGTLFFFSLLGLIAKLINDLMYVWVDPRVQFGAASR
jgi:microcin C transport system permease protein